MNDITKSKMSDTKKIIIVDYHKIVRDGIKAMLVGNKAFSVMADVNSGKELMKLLKSVQPDIVILDIAMPIMDGIEITKLLNQRYDDIKILILTANSTETNIVETIKSGANGFLSKESSRDEFIKALNYIARGEDYYGESISNIIYKSYTNIIKGSNKSKEDKILTDRELDIMKAFSEGLSFKEIADKLNISARTVETHRNNILQKLELKNTIEMVKYAIKRGIVKL